ncbi:phosphoribosylaminoimidazolesuccinocarboxamide synthase [Patescibacteria group bacterium]|nr:phosphoribosylaminoimidazolesuccinocarboxamide synthase [Patescibacteria group bacterium]
MISRQKIIENIPFTLKKVMITNLGKRYQGKVRDNYTMGDKRVIITTDRQSAFDRVLGYIPFKGQVLTRISEFWFSKTADIVPNHLILVPDPNVMLVRSCKIIPIEMVVRGYITGVTDTSIWGSYEKGNRVIYGIKFPEGLRKNQKLSEPIITPTTKAGQGHDERLTGDEIIKRKIVSPKIWKQMKETTLALFERGQKICDRAGIILVDTKYEFGIDKNGELVLVDEIHTPDSSRYWIKKTYKKRFSLGKEPESNDKEPLRIWFKKQGFTGKGKIPKMPSEFIAKMSMLYMGIYEKIIGKKFVPDLTKNVKKRIKDNLKEIVF